MVKTYIKKLISLIGVHYLYIIKNVRMDDIEMVKRYAHLSPNNLNEHARQIDAIFNDRVPNMSHETDFKLEINAK
jgi:hypothetical protein